MEEFVGYFEVRLERVYGRKDKFTDAFIQEFSSRGLKG